MMLDLSVSYLSPLSLRSILLHLNILTVERRSLLLSELKLWALLQKESLSKLISRAAVAYAVNEAFPCDEG